MNKSAIAPLIQLYAAHLILNLPQIFDHGWAVYLVFPSSDLVLFLWMVLAAAAWPRLFSSRKFATVLGVTIVMYLAVGMTDGFSRAYWRQPVDLWREAALLGNLFDYLRDTYGPLAVPGTLLVAGLGLGLVGHGLLWVICSLGRRIRALQLQQIGRMRLLVAIGLLTPLFSLVHKLPDLTDGFYPVRGIFSVVRRAIMQSVEVDAFAAIADAKSDIAGKERLLSAASLPARSPLGAIHGASVFLILVESYGSAAFDRPDYDRQFRPHIQEIEAQVRKADQTIASGNFRSTRFGGGSWMAEMALSCGLPVDSNSYYRTVLASQSQCLPHFFSKAGYHTIDIRPGVTKAWNQGQFFAFAESWYGFEMGYDGPKVGWGRIPDQFTLAFAARLLRRRPENDDRPTFVEISLVSSHSPWQHIPRLLQAQESPLANGGAIYQTQGNQQHFSHNSLTFSGAGGAYIQSIVYSLRSAVDFVANQQTRPFLAIILGDHQPNAKIAGSDASWNVPVHVISNELKLVEPFWDLGFVNGAVPPKDADALPFQRFLPWFVVNYGEPRLSNLAISSKQAPSARKASDGYRTPAP